MALRTRAAPLGLDTNINTREIARTSRLVSMLTGYPVPPNKAIVGANAFAHEAGIHQHGVMVERTTYEIMDPHDVGLEGSQDRSRQALRPHAFAKALEELGFTLDERGRRSERSTGSRHWPTARSASPTSTSRRSSSTRSRPTTTSTSSSRSRSPAAPTCLRRPRFGCVRGDEMIDESAIGDGMIDAACGAIQRATGIEARLESFYGLQRHRRDRCSRRRDDRAGHGGRRRPSRPSVEQPAAGLDRRRRGFGPRLPLGGQPTGPARRSAQPKLVA